jgi:Protein of unknown function (DUF1501)
MSGFVQGPTRRAALRSLVGGSILLPGVLSRLLAADEPPDPLAPKKPHFEPKAKRVIFLFSTGGVSHLDTFDPKDKVINADGKTKGVGGGLSDQQRPLLRAGWKYKPGGKCGTLVSDLFPHIRDKMDDIALVRSMKTDDNEHYQATLAIHTGSFFFARPSMGSWLSYGLGTVNQNLPSFVVISPYLPYAGSLIWSNDFLPAYHQGTRVLPGKEPIANLKRPIKDKGDLQSLEMGLADAFNKGHLKRNSDPSLAARIRSFETAYRMQTEAPEVFDLSKEKDSTLALYGLKRGQNDGYGWQCLVARRMIERGVRFVELIDRGASDNWDSHADMKAHEPLARAIDKPIAGLLTDLKQRGMLDDTLVVWTTEFGRTPGIDGDKGRGHHGACFSSWLAGGGIKGGIAYGKTDDIGAKVAENEVHVHDFHATILHLLGFDHEKLTYRHAGRDYRLTDVHGKVVKELLS